MSSSASCARSSRARAMAAITSKRSGVGAMCCASLAKQTSDSPPETNFLHGVNQFATADLDNILVQLHVLTRQIVIRSTSSSGASASRALLDRPEPESAADLHQPAYD